MAQTIHFKNRALIIADEAMRRTLDLATRAASSSLPVLLVGQSGTGKELVARYIHEKSPRARGNFVSINCAAIPDGLMEAELFGFERGAFTGAVAQRVGKFERASGGSLLLDEVSEMPFHLQAKLLRALQEGEIDRLGGAQPVAVQTRVIATTNVDPALLIQKGTFRADLYYRLNVIRIDCPALGGRSEAIESLAVQLLRRACDANGMTPRSFKPEAMDRLRAYAWPGNIRELQNAVERALLVCDHSEIGPEHLDLRPLTAVSGGDLAAIEQQHILDTLSQSEGNRSEAARRLGISVRTLRNKLKEFNAA